MAKTAEDQPFQHYSFKHRIVAWISLKLFDGVVYTVRRGLLKGMKRQGGLAWIPELASGPASAEDTFWHKLDLKNKVIYDIGAFHGLLTLFFARQAKQVVSFEPSTKNRARLARNIKLNNLGNVTLRDVGLGDRAAAVVMISSTLMPGGSSLNPDMAQGMQHSGAADSSETISITTLDEDVIKYSLPVPDLLKIDVEGYEVNVLQGARQTLLQHHPAVFLEMHGETLNLKRQAVAAVVAELNDSGYRDILHIESGTAINAGNSAVAAEGHLYAR